jgi:hypothetical protein
VARQVLNKVAALHTIQAKVLGERLANSELVTILSEFAHRKRITITITRSKALVGTVEQDEVAAVLGNLGDLGPLAWSRIDAGWVVSASMQQQDTRSSRLQSSQHSVIQQQMDQEEWV